MKIFLILSLSFLCSCCALLLYHNSPFVDAVERKDVAAVKKMIKEGADVNQTQSSSSLKQIGTGHSDRCNFALTCAAYNKDLKMIKLLVENKADVNKEDSNDWTALHVAVWGNSYDIAQYLLENGAKAKEKSWRDVSPLDYAKEKGNRSMVELLERY